MPATVTAKGQITIPKTIRDALGVKPGSRVDFRRTADGGIEIIKEGPRPKSPLEKYVGVADAGLTTAEIMAMTRGED